MPVPTPTLRGQHPGDYIEIFDSDEEEPQLTETAAQLNRVDAQLTAPSARAPAAQPPAQQQPQLPATAQGLSMQATRQTSAAPAQQRPGVKRQGSNHTAKGGAQALGQRGGRPHQATGMPTTQKEIGSAADGAPVVWPPPQQWGVPSKADALLSSSRPGPTHGKRRNGQGKGSKKPQTGSSSKQRRAGLKRGQSLSEVADNDVAAAVPSPATNTSELATSTSTIQSAKGKAKVRSLF